MSQFKAHCEKWKNGCGSPICSQASNVVIGRGTLPCDILMVGEASGVSEDTIGRPFVGPAGQLLDMVLRVTLAQFGLCDYCRNKGDIVRVRRVKTADTDGWECPVCYLQGGHISAPTYAITNLVGCLPTEDGTVKLAEPDVESIMSCAPRLQEFIDMANPRMVVCVGKLAANWLRQGYKNPVIIPKSVKIIDILHPAFILRSNIAQRPLLVQQTVSRISTALMEVFG